MEDKAFILDFNLLKEHDLSIDEFITIIHLKNDIVYNDSSFHLKILEEKKFIKLLSNNQPILREKGETLVKLISIRKINSESNKVNIKKSERLLLNEVDSFIKEFRDKWKGLKPGSMGSLASCRIKMMKWMKDNPEYTPENILKAADIYIKSLNNYTYLQQSDYFIYKKEGVAEHSRLSAFIDEIDNAVDDDWTSHLK
jgi:hypothetical protein